MKRMIVGLGLTLAGVLIATGFGTSANAATATLGPPWVLYKDLPDLAACSSAGYYFEQQGIIQEYSCDEIVPPSPDARGDVELWVIF